LRKHFWPDRFLFTREELSEELAQARQPEMDRQRVAREEEELARDQARVQATLADQLAREERNSLADQLAREEEQDDDVLQLSLQISSSSEEE
jgi:hypothetical protein